MRQTRVARLFFVTLLFTLIPLFPIMQITDKKQFDSIQTRAFREPEENFKSSTIEDIFGESVCCPLPRDVAIARHLLVRGDATFLGDTFFEEGSPGIPKNTLIVTTGTTTSPYEFNSIKEAVDSITTNASTNPFIVNVGPGVYTEDTITMKPYVSIVGSDERTTIVQVDDTSKDLFIGSPDSIISHLTLRGGTNSGKAAIKYTGGSGDLAFQVIECIFESADILFYQTATTTPTCVSVVNDCYINHTANFSKGFVVESPGVIPSVSTISQLVWNPTSNPSFTRAFEITGSSTTFIGSDIIIGSSAGSMLSGEGFFIEDGAQINLKGSNINAFDTAIEISSTGTGPELTINSVSGKDNTTDLEINNSNTTGLINGTFSRDKISIASGTDLSLFVIDPDDPASITAGPQFVGNTFDTITNISPQVQQGSNLGVISGGVLSAGAGTSIDATSGTGYVMVGTSPNDNLRYIEWNAQNIVLPTNKDNFIFIDENGMINSSLSEPDFITTIILGKARTTSTGILYIQNTQKEARHTAVLSDQSWRQSLQNIYASGSSVSKNGTLALDVTTGIYYFGTHEYNPSGGTTISWEAFYRDGSGDFNTTTQSLIDFDHYDDGTGTLATIPAGNFAKHSLYLVGEGSQEQYLLVYGQTTFTTLTLAQNGPIPPAPGSWTDNIVLIASIIVENTGVPGDRISEIRDERPRIGFQASGLSVVTDHGSLTGLLNDNHPQYLLADGTRNVTGDLTLENQKELRLRENSGNGTNYIGIRAPLALGANYLLTLPTTISADDDTITADASGNLSFSKITNANIDAAAAISDTKLATITTTGKVANSATTATSSNTASSIVARDGSGDFSAGTITATLTGSASENVLKAGDTMTGNLTLSNQSQIQLQESSINGSHTVSLQAPAALAASYILTLPINDGDPNQLLQTDGSGNLTWSDTPGDILNGGQSGPITIGTNNATSLDLATNSTDRIQIASDGTITLPAFSTTGVLHNNASGALSSSLIVNADISAGAAIADTKLATISTAGKVANSATTATDTNTANAIVTRDASGNFNAGTITADLIGDVNGNVTGNVTGSASLNVLKSGDTMTGTLVMADQNQIQLRENASNGTDAVSIQAPAALATNYTLTLPVNDGNSNEVLQTNGSGALSWTTVGDIFNNGQNGPLTLGTNDATTFDLETNGTDRLQIASDGTITIPAFSTAGILHNNASGNLSSSLIVNADISPGAAIIDTKLATISTAGKVANSATTATDSNTANSIVSRDVSGNFSAGTITADLTGAASDNVLKSGDTMTGNLTITNTSDSSLTIAADTDNNDTTHANIILQENGSELGRIETDAANTTLDIRATTGNGIALQTNGANDRLTIDSAGNTTYTTNYRAAATMSTNQTLATAGASTVVTETIEFDTTIYDPNGNFNTGTYTYTVPVTGLYLITVNLSVDQKSNNNPRSLRVVQNGTPITGAGILWISGASVGTPKQLCTVVSLTSGDAITVDYSSRNAADVLLADQTTLTNPPTVTGASSFYIHLLSV